MSIMVFLLVIIYLQNIGGKHSIHPYNAAELNSEITDKHPAIFHLKYFRLQTYSDMHV